MGTIEQKHLDAAGDMSEVFVSRLCVNRQAVQEETLIAAAARMAGMMLFRSFGFDTSKMEPGSVVLSEEANQGGPMLVGIVSTMLTTYGLVPDEGKLANTNDRGDPPKLSLLDMQEILEEGLTRVREKHQLSLEDGAKVCALTAAWLIKECAPAIGLEAGFNLAVYSVIEGTKTAPAGQAKKEPPKRSWLRVSQRELDNRFGQTR